MSQSSTVDVVIRPAGSSEKLDVLLPIECFTKKRMLHLPVLELRFTGQGRSTSHVKSQYLLSIPLELSGGETVVS